MRTLLLVTILGLVLTTTAQAQVSEAISRPLTVYSEPYPTEAVSRSLTVYSEPPVKEAVSRALTVFSDPTIDVSMTSTSPSRFVLRAGRPNPFELGTVIGFDIGATCEVTVTIYDMQGRVVRTLVPVQVMKPGSYRVTWDGRSQRGRPVGSGMYWYKLRAGTFEATRSVTLLR